MADFLKSRWCGRIRHKLAALLGEAKVVDTGIENPDARVLLRLGYEAWKRGERSTVQVEALNDQSEVFYRHGLKRMKNGSVEEIVECLRNGGVVLLPTDTVYGLAVSPNFDKSIDRLFALKRRPRNVNLPIMVSSDDGA